MSETARKIVDELWTISNAAADQPKMIALIAAALDAERQAVWEEAAKGLEEQVKYGPSDEAYDNEVGKDGDGTSYNQGVQAAIRWCRQQFHDDGEGVTMPNGEAMNG